MLAAVVLALAAVAAVWAGHKCKAERDMLDFIKPDAAHDPKEGDVVKYVLEKKRFMRFLRDPSIGFISGNCSAFTVYGESTRRYCTA